MAVLPDQPLKPLSAKVFTKSVSPGRRERGGRLCPLSAHAHTGFAGISRPTAGNRGGYRSVFSSDTRVSYWNTCFMRDKSLLINELCAIYAPGGSIRRLDHKNGQANGHGGKQQPRRIDGDLHLRGVA